MDTSPEHWQRVSKIFAAAIECEPGDRKDFVSRECAGDEGLERELQSLLRHHESRDGLFEEPFCLARPSGLLAAGSKFGKYTITLLLGSGGMGDVYLAEDPLLNRRVALKLLPLWLALDQACVARFRREALAASRLTHPNVPVVYEAGEIDGQHYIATEFIQGITLAERLSRGSIPWREALGIAIPVGHALAAAHAYGIVHRDVKPGNILIREDGNVKLADFGIAKLQERSVPVVPAGVKTETGTIIGTPVYMAPERLSGQPVDARTDIWSLGVVLHEMILGCPPSQGETVPGGSRLAPKAVWKAIERALKRDPAQRFATAQEFVDALEFVSRLHPSRVPKPLRYAGYGAIMALTLIAGYYGIASRRTAASAELFQVGRISKLTTSGKAVDAAISPDGRYVLYVADEGGLKTVRLRERATGADTVRIDQSNAIYSGLTFNPDGNSFYYLRDENRDLRALYRAPLIEGAPVEVIRDVDSPPAISPDGRQIEFARGIPAADETALFVAAADGTNLRQIASRPYSRAFLFNGASWSADQKSIWTAALEAPQTAVLLEVRVFDGRQKRLGHSAWRWIGGISSMANGHGLVFPAADTESISPQIYQLLFRDEEASPVTTDLASYPKASASVRDIVAVQEDRLSAIWITSLERPSRSRRVTPPAGRYWQLAWSPDGSLLSQTSTSRELNVWRFLPDGSTRQVTTGPHIDWNTVVSADGKRLAFISNRTGGFQLWTSDSEGHFLRQLTHSSGRSSSPSFLPDGSIVYCESTSGSSGIYRISPGGGPPVRLLSQEAC